MKEKPELDSIESLPEESGEDHKVVVMNPYKIIIWANNFKNLISKNLVCRDVGLPQRTIKAAAKLS